MNAVEIGPTAAHEAVKEASQSSNLDPECQDHVDSRGWLTN
jgi:hypothetical protein